MKFHGMQIPPTSFYAGPLACSCLLSILCREWASNCSMWRCSTWQASSGEGQASRKCLYQIHCDICLQIERKGDKPQEAANYLFDRQH